MNNANPPLRLTCLLALALTSCLGCGSQQDLTLFCGAGIRPAAVELVEEFNKTSDRKIECDFAGSEILLSRIKLSGQGDLYMPGDVHYVEQAEEAGLMDAHSTACYFVPVILVQKGNPKKIQSLADLTRPELKIGLGDPKACAIGRKASRIFKKNDIDEEKLNVVFRSVTVNELGNHIKVGSLDAAIVWDAVAAYFPDDAEVVAIPTAENVISTVALGVLESSQHPETAARFVDFVTSEAGQKIFAKHNYTVEPPGP